jgi:hypothetical protein
MLVRFLSVLLVVAGALALPAAAHDYTLGDLTIVHPWARASAGEAKNGAAYLDVINNGSETDRLIAASTPAAEHAELHMHAAENGIMKMRPVEAIEIAPGQHIVLQPGGFHLMLMGLAAPLVEGESFPLTLTFEKAGNIEVSAEIASVGTMHSDHGSGESTQ